MKCVYQIAETMDKLKVTRRVGFYFTLWLTYMAIMFCVDFAKTSDLGGMEIAAIIAAIMAPITGLQGFITKFHHDGYKNDK